MNSNTAYPRWGYNALKALSLAAILALSLPVSADELRVRHRVYKGTVTGKGHEPTQLQVDIQEISKALELKCKKLGDGYWVATPTNSEPPTTVGAGMVQVGNQTVNFTPDGDKAMVNLKDLSDALEGKLVYNKDTEILDFYVVGKPEATAAGWGSASSHYRILFFGNDSAPACKHFRPSLKQYEKDSKTPVIWIDTAKTNSDDYRNFIHYFQGNMIPHTVLISRDGKVWKRWTGSIPLGKFATEANNIIKIPR